MNNRWNIKLKMWALTLRILDRRQHATSHRISCLNIVLSPYKYPQGCRSICKLHRLFLGSRIHHFLRDLFEQTEVYCSYLGRQSVHKQLTSSCLQRVVVVKQKYSKMNPHFFHLFIRNLWNYKYTTPKPPISASCETYPVLQ